MVMIEKRLKDAFITLLNEKSIENITVREIAKTAYVSYASFYNYYTDKYDLLSNIMDPLIDQQLIEIDKIVYLGRKNFVKHPNTLTQAAFRQVLLNIKENQRYYSALFSSKSGIVFNDYIDDKLNRKWDWTMKMWNLPTDYLFKDVQNTILNSSILSICALYLSGDCKKSVDELGKFLTKTFVTLLKFGNSSIFIAKS